MNFVSTTTTGISAVYEDMNSHKGWICPKCGRGVSPDQKTCPYCSATTADEGLATGEQMICESYYG